MAALRLRYGFTPREARGRLEAMKREPQMSLQEAATVFEEMGQIAYAGLLEDHQLELTK